MATDVDQSRLDNVIEALHNIGYEAKLLDDAELASAVTSWPVSQEYSHLCGLLCTELAAVAGIDSQFDGVTVVTENESAAFAIELTGFLKEYGCPVSAVYTAGIDSLGNQETRLDILDFLLGEVQAVRMLAVRHSEAHAVPAVQSVSLADASAIAAAEHLSNLAACLEIPLPNDVPIDGPAVIGQVRTKIAAILPTLPVDYIGRPLLTERLSPAQLAKLADVNTMMEAEYGTRRRVLLKRLDLTIQAFKWSEKAKKHEDELIRVYAPLRRRLSAAAPVSLYDVRAARDDLVRVVRISDDAVRQGTKSALLGSLLIGKVPDRGGRVSDTKMPSFQKRNPFAMERREFRPSGGRGGSGGSGGDNR
eukprot:Opistho-2@86139